MWIFYVNYPGDKRVKVNILIIEDRKLIGIDGWKLNSINHFMVWLFGGRWILKNFIGVKLEEDWVILHLRGDYSNINYMLKALTRSSLDGKFNIQQRSLTVHGINYLKRCPNYEKRRTYTNGDMAYKKVLDKVIPNTKFLRKN